jgi:hypothetical protein
VSGYFIMEGRADGQSIALLYSLTPPGPGEGWLLGRRFRQAPALPVRAVLIDDFEDQILLPLYSTPQIMTNALYEALVAAGVDNLEVYPAVVCKEDGTVVSEDYKAFNLLGVVSAADASKSVFNPLNPSRLVDASFETLALAEERCHDLLMFRLAEYTAAVVVHTKLKQAIEALAIPNIVFTAPSDYLS